MASTSPTSSTTVGSSVLEAAAWAASRARDRTTSVSGVMRWWVSMSVSRWWSGRPGGRRSSAADGGDGALQVGHGQRVGPEYDRDVDRIGRVAALHDLAHPQRRLQLV